MSTETGPRALGEVIQDIRDDPGGGRLTLSVSGANPDGVACEVQLREHRLAVDEPGVLGGTDTGPNPVELVLAALGACQAITYRIWAAQMGIALDEVRFETEGDIDIAGLFGVRDGVRPGLGAVRHRVVLIGPESETRYRELMAVVEEHCPVLDILANPVPVQQTMDARRSHPTVAGEST